MTTTAKKTETVLFILALLAVLILAAAVRLENITQVGMWTWPDSDEYVHNALNFPTLGSEGQYRFQPTTHLIHAAFLAMIGDTDYSLKIASIVFDLANCVLISVLIVRLTRSKVLGLLGVVFYAFTPAVVFFARNELAHPIAATFTTLTFLAFVLHSERAGTGGRRPALLLALAGMLGGLAAGTHQALLFLGPAYIVGIFLLIRARLAAEGRTSIWRGMLVRFVKGAGCFTAFFFLPLIAFALLIPKGEWSAAISYNHQIRTDPSAWFDWQIYSQALRDMTHFDHTVVENAIIYLLVGLRWIVDADGFYVDIGTLEGRGILSYVFLSLPFVMIIVRMKRPGQRFTVSELPLILVVFSCLGIGFVSRVFALHSARYLLNLYPVVVVMIVACHFHLCGLFLPRRFAVLLMSGLVAILYAVHPHVYPRDARLAMMMNSGKKSHNLVGERVDENNKLLILPHDINLLSEGLLTHRHLFGEHAFRIRDMPYSGETLAQMCEREKVRFVYIGRSLSTFRHWHGFTRGWDKHKPKLPEVDFYGRRRDLPERSETVYADAEAEAKLIDACLKTTRARCIWPDLLGQLYELRQYPMESKGSWWQASHLAEEDEQLASREQLEALGYLSGYEEASENPAITVHDPARACEGVNLFMSGHRAQAILMDMSGNTLHSWAHDFFTEWPDHQASEFVGPELHQFWRRAHVFPNGDLLAIYEKLALVKLDRDSNVLWTRKFPHHHDLRVLPDDRILLLGTRIAVVERINEDEEIFEDFIMLLDQDGNELERISVLECLENSDYRTLLDTVELEGDFLHTNSVQRLDGRHADKAPAFAAGNYLISLPFLNTVAIIDPAQHKVVWALTGAWRFQHDPDLLDNGNILIFDNQGNDGMSKTVEIDPQTQHVVWAYRGTEENGFFSQICGANQRLPNGNTLIVETTGGRAFEVTPRGDIVWEFNNPNRAGPNNELVAILPDLIRLPASFGQDWWAERDAVPGPTEETTPVTPGDGE